MKLALLSSGIALVFNVVLIPTFGILGFLATNIVSGVPSLVIALWWIKKNYGATINWVSSAKILLASILAAAVTYVVTSQLSLPSWMNLIVGAILFLATYLVATPLFGAINKTDIHTFQEIVCGLGPLASLFVLPLSLIERLVTVFQRD